MKTGTYTMSLPQASRQWLSSLTFTRDQRGDSGGINAVDILLVVNLIMQVSLQRNLRFIYPI